MSPSILSALLLAGVLFIFPSCRVSHGLKIMSPELGASLHTLYPEINSLQPTLCWKGKESKKGDPYTYDVAIYKTTVDEKTMKKSKTKKVNGQTVRFYRGIKKAGQSWGTLIYTRDSLSTTCHTVEIPLDAGTYYTWAVQLRQGGKGHGWSYMNFHRYYGLSSAIFKFIPFGFVTPVDH